MSGRTVLIVDDEPMLAELYSVILDREGFRTVVAHDAETAVEAIKREKPDLMLLDIVMPGTSGLELCRRLRDDPDLSNQPIVLISGQVFLEDMHRVAAAGAAAYLRKPVTRPELIEAVWQVIDEGLPPAA